MAEASRQAGLQGIDDVYRAIVEQSLQGVVILQDDGIVYANPAIARITGRSVGELEAMTPGELSVGLHPDDRERLLRDIRSRLAGNGTPFHDEFQFQRKDGTWRWVEILASPLVHRGRLAVQIAYIDVTERKAAEQALGESEERFSRVFRGSPQPTIITAADGTILDVNEAFVAFCGYPPEEVVGRSPLEGVFAALCGAPEIVRELLETGRVRQVEMPLRTKDGQERHSLLSAQTITLGGRPCAIWQGFDFTDLKRARDALAASEARFRLLTESSSEWVTEIDERGRVVYVSAEFADVLGYRADQFIGRSVLESVPPLLHPDDRSSALEEFASALAGKQRTGSYRVRRSDGSYLWVESKARRIAAPDGGVHLVSITRDISEHVRAEEERRQLAEQVMRSQKLEGLGVLAGGIAHDFNNLLVAIQGNAELALSGLEAEHPVRALIEDLFRAAERGAGLTRELLAYAGRAQLSIEPVDLVELVREMTQLLRGSVAAGVELACEGDGQTGWVEADATQIRQVAMNLITNAAEALGERGGRVRVRTSATRLGRRDLAPCLVVDGVAPGEFICLEVGDDGCGMDHATQERIFDPFFTTKVHGRGLGLASVLGIVRIHGGTLRVESAPGAGTTFRVYLPRAAVPKAPAEPLARLAPAGARAEGTVLVVDDEPGVRAVARRMLERRGFEVLLAADGAEALAIAQRRAGALRAVVLDLAMPGLDGDRVFEGLRRIRGDLPVVFVSGHGTDALERRLSGRTRVAAVAKPFRSEALFEKLEEVTAPDGAPAPDAARA
jgi:PAS domain S-box-containing protein